MAVIGFKHWRNQSGGKLLSGILIGTGILLMVWATFLHNSRVGFVLGIAFVLMGLIAAFLASLDDKMDRRG